MGPDTVSDRLEITALLAAYAAAVDTKDWDGVRQTFTPDATVDFSSAGGPHGSVDEIIAWFEEVLAGFAVTQHLVTNVRITLDGDSAGSHAYLINPMQTPEGKTTLFGGAYRDRLARTPDGWRIAERTFEMSWSGRLG